MQQRQLPSHLHLISKRACVEKKMWRRKAAFRNFIDAACGSDKSVLT
jgi:hypothetical protein